MNIVFIHGHRATSQSFNFLSAKLSSYEHVFIDYDSQSGFYANHHDMVEQLKAHDDIFFVAHSLGGIHALHLTKELQSRVRGAVTISTPYGGSQAAEALALIMPFNKVLQDVQPWSSPILDGGQVELPSVWTNIVSVKGHTPLMMAANDGVVTLASMRHRDDIRLLDVDANHYEVLLNESTADAIHNSIAEIEAASRAKFFRPVGQAVQACRNNSPAHTTR